MTLTANEQAVLNQVAELDARIKDLTKNRDALLKKVDLTGFEAGDRVATSVGYVRFDSNRINPAHARPTVFLTKI